ncbi:Protein of unknown function [Amycolatopsis xylanica]|uniref:DUF3040 domain-containing protein n=1 Tax=Amycolatopsis xylanica TaxID=589385 RepID=A0A1H2ULR9_9PSEU|nr:DUF3040 domain-containing protein [Amycolatopsis xylanica]SDW56908.1 Protein of unknown function [Amycolatopsis xylanica]
MLSHHDRQELQKIEQWFELADPALVESFRRGSARKPFCPRLGWVIVADVFAVMMVLLASITSSGALVFTSLATIGLAASLHVVRAMELKSRDG